jgi:hypothetical protein
VTDEARVLNRGVGGISRRATSWLVWSLGLLSVVLLSTSAVLLVLNRPTRVVESAGVWGTANVPFIFLAVALDFTLVGALVASRRPTNPIGWITLAAGLSLALFSAAGEYAIYALLSQPGSLPGAQVAAWLREWIWVPFVGLVGTYLVLLFPDGRLPSSRWRMLAGLGVVALVFSSLSKAFFPGRLEETPGIAIANPFGIEAAREVLELLGTIGFFLLPLCFVASAASMLIRFSRSRGIERQQLKWFVSAAALLAVTFAATAVPWFVVGVLSGQSAQFLSGQRTPSLALKVTQDITSLTFAGLPIAAGIAILRYRLYDIDILINRTLVYGSLTVALALMYFGGVAGAEAIFRVLTGQEQQPQLAIVISTLVIAALFNPLRRRIQSFIDLRFYRRKYDAAKTLEAFSTKLRDETDLDALSYDLVEVVRETMQPARISLWLHPDPALKDKKRGAAIRESGHDE